MNSIQPFYALNILGEAEMFTSPCPILNPVQCEWSPFQSMNIYLKFAGHILLIFFNPRVVKDTIGSIAESEKEVESAARGMEYIIR